MGTLAVLVNRKRQAVSRRSILGRGQELRKWADRPPIRRLKTAGNTSCLKRTDCITFRYAARRDAGGGKKERAVLGIL